MVLKKAADCFFSKTICFEFLGFQNMVKKIIKYPFWDSRPAFWLKT
jgi:hypothetical protein